MTGRLGLAGVLYLCLKSSSIYAGPRIEEKRQTRQQSKQVGPPSSPHRGPTGRPPIVAVRVLGGGSSLSAHILPGREYIRLVRPRLPAVFVVASAEHGGIVVDEQAVLLHPVARSVEVGPRLVDEEPGARQCVKVSVCQRTHWWQSHRA
jgi:hypothetical protein